MKKLLTLVLLLTSLSAFANGIDDRCKQFTYKTAPVVKADVYICHREYAIAWSHETHNPVYTTEYLAANHTGSAPRSNDFRADPALPDQADAVTPSDYHHSGTACGPVSGKRTSSCDQGHMTPDQDFSATAETTSESFFMTNMVPQNFKNNEVIWKYMEIKIRGYAKHHTAGVYVISGPVYLPTLNRVTIGKHHVWVPDMLFKVMIDAQTGKSIAFYMQNAPLKTADLGKYVVSLATIEKVSGITFDPSLDKNAVANYDEWNAQTK